MCQQEIKPSLTLNLLICKMGMTIHLPRWTSSQVDMKMVSGRTTEVFCKDKCNIKIQKSYMTMVMMKAHFQ